LDLSPCTVLEALQIPIRPFAKTLLPSITSSRLAIVTLVVNGKDGQDTANVDDNSWKAIERDLHSLARRFNRAHPGKKMEVVFLTGSFEIFRDEIDPNARRNEVLETLRDERFMPKLKEETDFAVREIVDPE
jgi:cellobiose phosphorylase